MRLELYEVECQRIARDCEAMLDEAKRLLLQSDRVLSPLEQGGMLHALQVLIENAIGKAKHQTKAAGMEVPVSAYDVFAMLTQHQFLAQEHLAQWNAVVGLWNRIVHDYMNLDMAQISALVLQGRHQFVLDFLRQPMV